MRRVTDVWREQLRVWVPALIFFLVNLGVLSTYRLVFAGQAQLSRTWVERDRATLGRLETERRELEDLVATATANRERIERLYGEYLTPQRQRLTRVIAEVKELARRSGLEPTVLNYPEEAIQDYGLMRRSIVFTVEGTYVELRRLVNFLELSEYFLTLDEIGLAEGSGGGTMLRINLKISTLFADEEEWERRRGEPAAVEAAG